MQAKVMRDDGAMVYLLVFDEGEEVIAVPAGGRRVRFVTTDRVGSF